MAPSFPDHPAAPPLDRAPAHARPSLSPAPPSPTLAAAAMGCAASTAADGAEPRRGGWAGARASGHSEASTSGLQGQGPEAESSSGSGGRRRGSKVAPEPKELEEGTAALPPMTGPGSPSFRYYCQKKTAAVDRIVADSDNNDASVRTKATARQLSTRSEISETKPHDSSEVSQHKEGNRWLRFSGFSAVAAAWHNLFGRPRSKPSPPPAAASAAL